MYPFNTPLKPIIFLYFQGLDREHWFKMGYFMKSAGES